MIVSACKHKSLRSIRRILPLGAPLGLIQFRWGKASPRSELGEPVRRPGLRPSLPPIVHLLRSNRASVARQDPEPQALTDPLPKIGGALSGENPVFQPTAGTAPALRFSAGVPKSGVAPGPDSQFPLRCQGEHARGALHSTGPMDRFPRRSGAGPHPHRLEPRDEPLGGFSWNRCPTP